MKVWEWDDGDPKTGEGVAVETRMGDVDAPDGVVLHADGGDYDNEAWLRLPPNVARRLAAALIEAADMVEEGQ